MNLNSRQFGQHSTDWEKKKKAQKTNKKKNEQQVNTHTHIRGGNKISSESNEKQINKIWNFPPSERKNVSNSQATF